MAEDAAGCDAEAVIRYVRTVAWAVVGLLVLALVSSFVLDGFA